MGIIPIILLILGGIAVFSVLVMFFSLGKSIPRIYDKPLSILGGIGLVAVLGLLGILLVMIII
jgi:hypothetical protein